MPHTIEVSENNMPKYDDQRASVRNVANAIDALKEPYFMLTRVLAKWIQKHPNTLLC